MPPRAWATCWRARSSRWSWTRWPPDTRLYEAARQRERWIEGAAASTTALLTGESAADACAGVVLQPTAEGGMEIVTASTYDDPGDLVGTTIEPAARPSDNSWAVSRYSA
ncbi:hypothetical protein GCM10022232_26170 [Streptomyces plumbiresistens]|uniref:Uncharacterized protein n=1 Tax=Streptomyces plumbiresistens TaxID=511811 RepID=A0ABP7R0S6_9ACTN